MEGEDVKIKCFMIEPVPSSEHELWKMLDTGEKMPIAQMPAGAMWLCPWLSDAGFGSKFFKSYPQEIQKLGNLCVKTPAGDWNIDSKSSNGEGWTRYGEPPIVTARPSIGIPWPNMAYHAFLTDGYLEDC